MNRLLCFLLLITNFPFGSALAQSDTGSAHNLIAKYTINEAWFLSSRNLLTSRNGFDDFFFGYVDLNLGYNLGSNWSAEAGYRHAWLEINNDWRDEYRPSAILAYRTRLNNWTVANRHRIEYRTFEKESGANDRWRYRNETRLVAPWKSHFFQASPFIEEEIFYEFTNEGFNFNWLTTGLRWRVADNTIAKIGYRWQAQKFNETWSHRHQLVTGLLLFF